MTRIIITFRRIKLILIEKADLNINLSDYENVNKEALVKHI